MKRNFGPALAVALACALPAAATASGSHGWHGKTSQGQGMEFFTTSSGKLVQQAMAHYSMKCSDGSTVTSGFGAGKKFGDHIAISHGHYKLKTTAPGSVPNKGSGTATFDFEGTVSSHTVKGFIKIDFALSGGLTCSSGRITYTLH
jgi:hypothetical protein